MNMYPYASDFLKHIEGKIYGHIKLEQDRPVTIDKQDSSGQFG